MITVSAVVLQILQQDDVAREAALAGVLNLSAYAEKIKPEVEEKSVKEVSKGTIVVNLSRITKGKLANLPLFKPDVKIHNLDIRSPLYILIYDKTSDIQRRVATLNPFLVSPTDIFSVTEGSAELVLSCSEKSRDFIKKHIGILPKKEFENAVAVTLQFSEEQANTPNVLHTLFSALTYKRINLIYVVSGYTEITFLVNKKDVDETTKILDQFTRVKQKTSQEEGKE